MIKDTNDLTKCQWIVGGNLRTGVTYICGEPATEDHQEYWIRVCSECAELGHPDF